MARNQALALLPCIGIITFGVLSANADPSERTGADAPHQERNEAKNERKSALPVSSVDVPAFADKPVRKATAVKPSSADHKTKDKKKAEQQAKQKSKAEAKTREVVDEQPQHDYYTPAEDRVGSDAPHQERGTDASRRGARLFILER